MSRTLFKAELGFEILAENADSGVQLISGSAAPGGDSGIADAAPVGSMYIRQNGASSTIYQKVASGNSTSDWKENGSSGATIGTWRPEAIVAVTNDVQGAGTRDYTVSPFSDDQAPVLAASAFEVGKYVISDADGTPVLLEITGQSGDDVTFAAASSPLSADDTFFVRNYLPDSPGDQENQAIVNYNGSTVIKIADVDFAFATGIQLSSSYAAAAGNPVAGDTVEAAVAKLDGNNDQQDQVLGTSQGDTDLGIFSGATIPDGSSVKGALQSVETAYEETDANVDDLVTLSGLPENSTDNGTFTGSTIPDSSTTKAALQSLETAHETLSSTVTEIDGNVDDLITLSGMPENSTDNGTFAGTLLADSLTTKAALQRIEDLLEELKVIETTGVTAEVSADEVPVATVSACKWLVEAFEEATPANKRAVEVYGLNNGTLVDETVYAKLKVGSNFNLSVSVDISGGNMRLRVSSSTAGVTVRVRRIQVTNI